MFELFAIAIAIVALAVARKAMDQADSLRARLDALEAADASESATVAPPVEPTAPIHEAPPSVPSRGHGGEFGCDRMLCDELEQSRHGDPPPKDVPVDRLTARADLFRQAFSAPRKQLASHS